MVGKDAFLHEYLLYYSEDGPNNMAKQFPDFQTSQPEIVFTFIKKHQMNFFSKFLKQEGSLKPFIVFV